MKDYLQAYLQAALEEERIEDERFREAVERRAWEIARKLERPYQEALRLQALSKPYRAELTARIAAGEGAETLLPLALQTISALCGDEAFAAHNLARLQRGFAAGTPGADGGRGPDGGAGPGGGQGPSGGNGTTAGNGAARGDGAAGGNGAAVGDGTAAGNGAAAAEEDPLRAAERRELSGRARSLRAFIADESVPEGEREQARMRLEEVQARLRAL